jgi:hypothetical protein
MEIEKFVVKHYSEDERPIIKGNGFDGLEIGIDREEAEYFINYINMLISDINKKNEHS